MQHIHINLQCTTVTYKILKNSDNNVAVNLNVSWHK